MGKWWGSISCAVRFIRLVWREVILFTPRLAFENVRLVWREPFLWLVEETSNTVTGRTALHSKRQCRLRKCLVISTLQPRRQTRPYTNYSGN